MALSFSFVKTHVSLAYVTTVLIINSMHCFILVALDGPVAEDDGFSRAIKIRSTTSFGGEVKPLAPWRKILRHVKDTNSMKDIFIDKIKGHLPSFSCFATRCVCWFLPESSGA
jgi:hypothetical protein